MTRLSLDSVEWKEFFIGGQEGIFNISSTKSGIDKNKILEYKGSIPYITRSNINNGIDMFIGEKQEERYRINKGNVITIGLDTQTVFYQSNDFYTGQNIQVLENRFLNKEIALFLIPLLKIQMEKFSWGSTGATLTRLNRSKILLPINEAGNPNWQFMENYIKQEQKAQRQVIIGYYEKRILECGFELLGLENIKLEKIISIISMESSKYSLSKVDWKEFWIEDIADIKSGKDIYQRERLDGNTPYITATAGNNGIGYFIDNTNATLEENCISVNRNGSVGYSFYHPYKALYGNDTRKLIPRIKDKHISLFITTSITYQREKYGYGYKMGTGRLKRQKILLPIDGKGEVDYDFMKKFMLIQEIKESYKMIGYFI